MIYIILILIGVANALPLPLSGTNLSIYLSEKGFDPASIAFFSLLSFPFSIKLFWSFLIDHTSLPFFKKSPRKGWLLFSLLGMSLSFMALSVIDPQKNPLLFALSLFLLFLFAGALYMVGISYEIESLDSSEYSLGSASVLVGYRTGLFLGGALVLSIAHFFSWPLAFITLSFWLILAFVFVLLEKEPYKSSEVRERKKEAFSNYPSKFLGFWQESFINPCKAFFTRQDGFSILLIILLFKFGNHMVKLLEGPFYLDIGFTKADLALSSQTLGFIMAISGSLLGGFILKTRAEIESMAKLSLLHAIALIGYLVQAHLGKSYLVLYLTAIAINFTSGLAMTAFIRLLWKTCSQEYASMQYAILMSLFSLNGNVLSFLGGFFASIVSWEILFLTITFIAILTSILLVWLCYKKREYNLINISKSY